MTMTLYDYTIPIPLFHCFTFFSGPQAKTKTKTAAVKALLFCSSAFHFRISGHFVCWSRTIRSGLHQRRAQNQKNFSSKLAEKVWKSFAAAWYSLFSSFQLPPRANMLRSCEGCEQPQQPIRARCGKPSCTGHVDIWYLIFVVTVKSSSDVVPHLAQCPQATLYRMVGSHHCLTSFKLAAFSMGHD